MSLDTFTHRFEPATLDGLRPLLLLHGTGGSEDDLIPLARRVAPGAALLAPRGRVLEGDLRRYFRRFAEGVLDEDDVARQTDALAAFVADARRAYGLAAPIAIGFSNGANVAAAVLMRHPEALAGAALLRAMMPLQEPPAFRLPATPVLLLPGGADRMIPAGHPQRLAATLEQAGATLEHRVDDEAGHGVGERDFATLRQWLQSVILAD